jgi:PTS system nitrogen regulatory IIA component
MDKIFYTTRNIAKKLGVSEKTVYRMLTDNQLPFAVKIGGQWRFRADAMDSWLKNPQRIAKGANKNSTRISLCGALHQGSVLYRIHGKNRDECIDELLVTLPYSTAINQQSLKVSIFARESLASTSMQGIAAMGISDEQPVYAEKSMVIIAFLEKPADFKALDNIPAEVFFLVLPANRGEQAILETRLCRLLQEGSFREAIKKQPPRHELIQLIEDFEAKVFKP